MNAFQQIYDAIIANNKFLVDINKMLHDIDGKLDEIYCKVDDVAKMGALEIEADNQQSEEDAEQ